MSKVRFFTIIPNSVHVIGAFVANALSIAFLTKVGGRTSPGEISELSRKSALQLVAASGVPDRPCLPSRPPASRSSLHRGAMQVDVTGDWPKAILRRLWQPNRATRICMLHDRAIWRQCSMIKQSRDANYSPLFDGAQLAATEPIGLFAKRKQSCVFKASFLYLRRRLHKRRKLM